MSLATTPKLSNLDKLINQALKLSKAWRKQTRNYKKTMKPLKDQSRKCKRLFSNKKSNVKMKKKETIDFTKS